MKVIHLLSQTISALHLTDIWFLLGSLYYKKPHYLSAPNHLEHAVELQVILQAKPRS